MQRVYSFNTLDQSKFDIEVMSVLPDNLRAVLHSRQARKFYLVSRFFDLDLLSFRKKGQQLQVDENFLELSFKPDPAIYPKFDQNYFKIPSVMQMVKRTFEMCEVVYYFIFGKLDNTENSRSKARYRTRYDDYAYDQELVMITKIKSHTGLLEQSEKELEVMQEFEEKIKKYHSFFPKEASRFARKDGPLVKDLLFSHNA